jgi:hypothetical protein
MAKLETVIIEEKICPLTPTESRPEASGYRERGGIKSVITRVYIKIRLFTIIPKRNPVG